MRAKNQMSWRGNRPRQPKPVQRIANKHYPWAVLRRFPTDLAARLSQCLKRAGDRKTTLVPL